MNQEKARGLHRACVLIFVLFWPLSLLTGCGGGGDGGGGGGGGINYTGFTAQAQIDSNNAVDIAISAFQGGSTGNAGVNLGIAQSTIGPESGQADLLTLSQTLGKIIRQVNVNGVNAIALGVVEELDRDTIPGECGGNVSYVVNGDDQTGQLSGSFNFDNFCENGSTTSGTASVSGRVDLDTGEIVEFKLSFSSLNTTSAGDSFTASGDMAFTFSASTMTVVINTFLRDDSTSKVYWAKDYTITITEGTSSIDITFSGQFYHPDYGYVILSTETPLRINGADNFPSSGVLIFQGSGNTKARLTALSSTTFQVEADTDGNGTYDCNSGSLNWANPSPGVCSTPPGSLPAAPTGLNALPGDGQVTISWNPVSGASSYNLYMASVSGVTKTNYNMDNRAMGSVQSNGVTH